MSVREELLQKLAPYKQEHLLSFWDELNEDERDSLRRQIDDIDFSALEKLFLHRNDPPAAAELAFRAEEPSTSFKLSDLRDFDCSENSPFPQSEAHSCRRAGYALHHVRRHWSGIVPQYNKLYFL